MSAAGSSLVHLHLPARAQAELGLSDALVTLSGLCPSPWGREALLEDPFPDAQEELKRRLLCAMEAKGAVARKVSPDFGGLREVRQILDAVDKGVVLSAPDILDVARTIDALGRLHDLLVHQDDCPLMGEDAARIADERRFARRVLRSFDETGALTDDASPELASARARVRALRAEAQAQLLDLVRELDAADLLRDRNFTIRNDRYVLPVKSEFQGRVEGIVHDASQTHQTVFIEPRALLQLGNRIKIARADVEQEEARILREMSLEVAELGPRLHQDLLVAGQIEASFARGAFAYAIDGVALHVRSGARLELRRARHPLLAWMRAQADKAGGGGSPVVANEISFGDARALVVSGPNAGGKTVALKTVGLIAALARAGIPVPVDEGSSIPCYASIAVSIGDEQSIQGALSTFSGHLTGIRGIFEEVRTHAVRGPVLCLLDELMAGTDPAQGAALGQAVLESLVDEGAFVVVTTHYDRLKALAIADAEEGGRRRFRNASVRIDSRTGRPTFSLTLDEVGTSNAIEAAQRYGLPDAVLRRADALLAPEQRELHALLRVLAEQKGALESRVAEAESERARFFEESQKLERRLADVERERAHLRREGKRAFVTELEEARGIVKDAIEAAKSKDARALNKASHALHDLDQRTRADLAPAPMPKSALLRPGEVKVGDVVELASMPGTRFSVLEVLGEDVIVGRGPVRTRSSLDALRAPGESDGGKPKPRARADKGERKDAEAPKGSASEPRSSDNTLDVRGQRVDEGLEMLEAFLDRLLRQGRTRGFVLHGHGSGAMKKAIRQQLSASRYVSQSAPAELDEGGDAWTVVQLS